MYVVITRILQGGHYFKQYDTPLPLVYRVFIFLIHEKLSHKNILKKCNSRNMTQHMYTNRNKITKKYYTLRDHDLALEVINIRLKLHRTTSEFHISH